jgi:4-hydroxybenzoate polyprenyltransferase
VNRVDAGEGGPSAATTLGAAWELARPFTLVAPALGVLSGALTAYGARPRFAHARASATVWVIDVAVAALAAGMLNGASNVLNQVYDLPIDRINKPSRVLPSDRFSVRGALGISVVLYAVSLGAAAAINLSVMSMFALGALATVLYSAPPFRTKRFGWWANVTIAIPRGLLLKVAGWSVTKSILAPEAWLIGAVFALFLVGATTSKDFADVEGDRAHGCRTLPVRYGRKTATRLIHPFFTLPFLLLSGGAAAGLFTGNHLVLEALGVGCAVWGHIVVRMLQKDPTAQVTENHPSWRHMYYLMFTLQIGLGADTTLHPCSGLNWADSSA